MTAQSVILPLPSEHARFLVLKLGSLSIHDLKKHLTQLLSTRDLLISQHPKAEIKLAVGFGPQLWQQLHPAMPAGFKALAAKKGAVQMPAVEADLILHIASARADLCFLLSQNFMQGIESQLEVLDERICFRYLDSRDLTGFIDGTENPQQVDERAETALLAENCGDFADGSFIFAQRYVHDLPKWQRLTVDAQEHVFGRTKLESIEMDDETKPDNAHIARVVIEDDEGEELEIVRHSLPYGDAHGEKGLFFIAYTKDLSIIDHMLDHMFGLSNDGIHDRLLNFVTPQDGAYYFAPSEELLETVLDAE